MELPKELTGEEPIINVPGSLPSLWPHQHSALQRMYAFERMVQEHAYSDHMPLSTPRGILALAPGAGKSRVVLALCLSEPRVKTIIIVLPNMVEHWSRELSSVGIHKGDQYVRVISNLQAHHVLNASITDYRIVYDETESLRNAAGKPATKFVHEHDMSDPKNKYAFPAQPYVLWLLDGSYEVQSQVATHHVQTWSLEGGPSMSTEIHVPRKGSAKASAFGLDYFPINVVQCDGDFVMRSQSLNLMAPTMQVVTMNDQLAHLTFLNDGTLPDLGNNVFATCVSIKDVAHYCKTMKTELYKEMQECDDVLHRFDDDLLLNIGVELMSLNDGGNNDQAADDRTTLATPLGMNNRSIMLMVNDAKARKDKARCKLSLLEKLINDDQKCAICWSQEIVQPTTISPCCYTRYCYYCIHPWVSAYNNCPLCRKVLTVSELLIDGESTPTPPPFNANLPMHPFAILEQFAILPAQQHQKLVLVYFDDTRRNRKDIEEHIDFCVRTYNRELCCSALKYPSALREFSEDNEAPPTKGKVLFITESVGLKGLNMCAADHLVIMSPINSSKMTQLLGRVQRPGRRQNHPFFVYVAKSIT